MQVYTFVFVFVVALGTALRLWLNHRQMAAVAAHRDRVPEPFRETVNGDDHRRAADYTLARGSIERIDIVLETLVLLALTVGGGIAAIDAIWRDTSLPASWSGIGTILSVLLLSAALSLPLSIWRTFGVEAKFGFNRTTPLLYVQDLLKSLLVAAVLGIPLLFVILWIMVHLGSWWWLAAWLVWTGFTLFITWAWPAFIAPLFNKFLPLADETLRERIERLLTRCGFASRGVYVVDGSRRSTHGNAYFTGLGRNKRIVFFDTLLERLGHGQVEAVLAHELGHFRLHHVRKRLLVSAAMSLLALALLGWLARQPQFYAALGVDVPSAHAALLLFMLASSPFAFFLTPIAALWSRKHEYEADAFAAQHASAGELADALVRLYRDNATTLTPDRVHSAFYDSHPPALARIERLKQLGHARV